MLKFINKTKTPTTVQVWTAKGDEGWAKAGEKFVRLVKGVQVKPGKAVEIKCSR